MILPRFFVWLAFVTLLRCYAVAMRGIPLISANKVRRNVMNRESVKKLQLQSMLRALEKDEDAEKMFTRSSDTVKRDLEGNAVVNTDLSQLMHGSEAWDIIRRQVPFDALIRKNTIARRKTKTASDAGYLDKHAPNLCRRKRMSEKRSLDTPRGEGLLPEYSIYDEMCEDSQPVEVVKINRLIVEDGVIRDQNIVEKAMFMS